MYMCECVHMCVHVYLCMCACVSVCAQCALSGVWGGRIINKVARHGGVVALRSLDRVSCSPSVQVET